MIIKFNQRTNRRRKTRRKEIEEIKEIKEIKIIFYSNRQKISDHLLVKK